MGFSSQEYWNQLPCPSPRDLRNPGIEPRSPTLQADFLLADLRGKSTMKAMQNRKRDTYVQNSLFDSVGEGEGGMFERTVSKHVYYQV